MLDNTDRSVVALFDNPVEFNCDVVINSVDTGVDNSDAGKDTADPVVLAVVIVDISVDNDRDVDRMFAVVLLVGVDAADAVAEDSVG